MLRAARVRRRGRVVTLAESDFLHRLVAIGERIRKGASMVHLVMKTDNAAFADGNYGPEVARILRRIADEAESGCRGTWKLRDHNGNTVGSVTVGREQ